MNRRYKISKNKEAANWFTNLFKSDKGEILNELKKQGIKIDPKLKISKEGNYNILLNNGDKYIIYDGIIDNFKQEQKNKFNNFMEKFLKAVHLPNTHIDLQQLRKYLDSEMTYFSIDGNKKTIIQIN